MSLQEPGWLSCGDNMNTDMCKNPGTASTVDGTAAEFCKQVQERATNIWDVAKSFANPLAAIIEAVSSTSSSAQSIRQALGINVVITTIAKQINSCNNITENNQSNIIKGPGEECLRLWKDMGLTNKELKDAGTIHNITQSNVNKTILNCTSNAVLEALSKMDATIDNQAIMEAINKAKGLMSNSTSDQNICNYIETNLSACKYVNQINCCNNYVQTNQSNLIDKGCTLGQFSNITQSNDSATLSKCTMSAQSSISDDISTKIFNELKQSSENTSEGLTMAFLIVIMIILGLIIGSPIILAKSLGKMLFSIIGVILLIAGGICISMYFITKKESISRNNNPLSTCDNTKLFQNPSRIKYGEINEFMNKNKNIIGYDFFPDNIKTDLSNISKDELGLVSYITQIDRNNINCDTTIDTEKDVSITYIKSSSDNKFVIIGTVLLIAGIVQILIGIFKKDKLK